MTCVDIEELIPLEPLLLLLLRLFPGQLGPLDLLFSLLPFLILNHSLLVGDEREETSESARLKMESEGVDNWA